MMEIGNLASWVVIGLTIGGFIFKYGQVVNRLGNIEKDVENHKQESEKRFDKVEKRVDGHDENKLLLVEVLTKVDLLLERALPKKTSRTGE